MTDNTPKWRFGIFREIMQGLTAGLSREDAAKQIDGSLGNKGCRKQERRYGCPVCLDSGRVEIWAPWLVAAFVVDGVHPDKQHHRSSDCACYCNKGDSFAKRQRHPLPRFDRLIHCQVVPYAGASGVTCNTEAVKNLLTWIEDQKSVRSQTEDSLFHQEQK